MNGNKVVRLYSSQCLLNNTTFELPYNACNVEWKYLSGLHPKDLFHLGGHSTISRVFNTQEKGKWRRRKEERKLLFYDLITNSNARIYKLSLLQHKTTADEDEKRRACRMNSYPPSEHSLFDARLKMDSEMSTYTLHVRACVCLGFGRERERSAQSGGKHPLRGPAFQLCDSLSPHRYSQTHACRFQGQILLQACGIKGNRQGCTASFR